MTQFEKTYNLMKKPWVIAIYAILVVLAYHFVDESLAVFLHQYDLRSNLYALKLLTSFGAVAIYLILFLLMGLYFRYVRVNAANEAKALYLFACIIIPNLVCLVLKVIFSRARPELLFSINDFGFFWFESQSLYWSFPSGHTTTIVSLAAGLGVLFPRYFYTLLALAVCVALSRVLLYYHYLSDIMTAFYISILVVGFFTQYLKRNQYLSMALKK